MGTFGRIISWLSHKLIFGAVLAVVALAGLGFWVYFRDQVDFDLRRLEIVIGRHATAAAVTDAAGAGAEHQGQANQDRGADHEPNPV